MSYEKIKNISLDKKNKKVFITSACNNLRPLTFERWESPSLSKIWAEQGLDICEAHILKGYEEGNFQNGTNKYSKALEILRYMFKEEYSRFDWRLERGFVYGSEEDKKHRALRDSNEFIDLLIKALKTKYPKQNYFITKRHNGGDVYAKVCPSCIKWKWTTKEASKFAFEQQAEDNIFKSLKNVCQIRYITPDTQEILKEIIN